MEEYWDRNRIRLGLALLVVLAGFSVYLGVNRIFQVDEVQNAFQARLLATGKAAQYSLSVPIFLLGPLTWLAGAAKSSEEVLVWLRLPFVALMWVNVVLLVKGAGFRLRSRAGLGALLLAATLAPMWDYGFEIRHDVLLLTGILGMWCLVRAERLPLAIRVGLLGFLAAFLQFIAFKAFVFSLPMLAILGLRFRPGPLRTWVRLPLALACGLALGDLAGKGISLLGGTWTLFRHDQASLLGDALHVQRFSCWPTMGRLLDEAPLLAYAGAAGMLAPFLHPGPFRFSEFVRRQGTAEWVFAMAALAALVVNPTPFPYNLIHLVPALFLLVLAFRHPVLEALAALPPQGRRLIVACLLLLHGAPWALATSRHLDMDNDHQLNVARLAETMTDPALDRVFDGSGLVSTRDPIGVNWLVHMFTVQNFSNGAWPTLRASLAAHPTPVLLPNYRFEMLPTADKEFIGAHYLALAPDFLVLGGVYPPGPLSWTALAAGRYHVSLQVPDGQAHPPLVLDGAVIQPGVQTLAKGGHQFQVPPGTRLQVVWLGPNLSAIPAVERSSRPLFVNWY